MSNKASSKNKAKRKIIGSKLSLHLIDIDKVKGYSNNIKTFWNTYYCQNKIYFSNGKTFGKYCKNRACPLCLGIRKAPLVNKYLPIIIQWEKPYFVVLTAMAVEAKHLPKRIDNMIKMFQDIKNTFKTRHRRGKGPKLVGVRTIESNFNAEKSTYNPHFNFIVETREMALILVEEWQKRLPKGYTTPKAQYYSSIENELQKLIEVIKYESKIFTEPDLNKKRKNQKVYALALYNILNAFKDHRLFGRFGFNGPKEAKKPNKLSVVVDYDIYHFDTTTANWIGSKGQKLTEFELNAHLEYLITEGVDMDLE